MADTMIMIPNIVPEPTFSEFVVKSNRSQLRGSTQVCPNNDFKTWQHQRQNLFGKNVSIIVIESRKYLIGVQVAKLLKRETFNLYRSMKVKGIEIIRAVSEQVEFLMRVNAVKRGTRSVTLIAYDPTVEFVESELQRLQKTEGVSARSKDRDMDSNDSDFDIEMSPSPSSRKRSSPSTSDFKTESKKSRSSSDESDNNEDDWAYSDAPEPWEILLSLAHGRINPEMVAL